MELQSTRFTMEECHEPLCSPDERLPFLMAKGGRCITGSKFTQLILQGSELAAACKHYTRLVHKHVRPAWLAAVWADPAIYKYVLRPIYTTDYSLPVRELLIWRMRARMTAFRLDDAREREFVASLQALAERLGDDRLFGGDRLSELDACVGPDLMLIPYFLPSTHSLHQTFSQFHNLYDYSIHLLHHYTKQ